MLYAQVVLPLAQPMYTFSLEESLAVEVGDAVVVQFGSFRFYTGIVWNITKEKPDIKRLKPILRKLYSTPLVTEKLQQLWEWVADYYMCTVGEVMRVAMPSLAKPTASSLAEIDERTIDAPTESYIALKASLRSEEALLEYHEAHRRAPRRLETMDRIAALAVERSAEDGFVPRRLVDAEAVHIADLRRRGLIVEESRVVDSVSSANDFLLPKLSEAQGRTLDAIHAAHADNKVALLHGVTGSGKTEIYIHLIAETLARGRDVLMLVPEIVITSQLIERLERIFEGRTTTYHSRLTQYRRGKTYLRLAASSGGELVVGVRSALFLPLKNLGLVVVDEEHDTGYKQCDPSPRYNARDAAVVLSRLMDARVVLGSATPSLESYANAISGKYAYAPLMERWGDAVLPEVVISDSLRALKRGERKTHFNLDLLQNIERSLAGGEQVMLFQNRRGYSPYMQCTTCGYSPRCPHCNVTLTQHRANRMECHYCGYTEERSAVCPNCQTQDMRSMGFGTEKVEEEVQRMFPDAVVDRLDGDTSTSESAFRRIVHRFEEGKTNILVGTQIITKGFDFGGVTTVGILNADNLVMQPNFRSSERAFQLMMQVAGRAGRRNDRGRVIIQTTQPQHPVIRSVAVGDYMAMASRELAERKEFGYPPYSRVVRFMLRHKDYSLLHRASHFFGDILRRKFGMRLMGPVSSAREMIRGEHCSELMLKIENGASFKRARQLIAEARDAMLEHEEYKRVTLIIDVDAL